MERYRKKREKRNRFTSWRVSEAWSLEVLKLSASARVEAASEWTEK